jgi:hypothetical protein
VTVAAWGARQTRIRRGGLLCLVAAASMLGIVACDRGPAHEGDPELTASLHLSPTPPMTGSAAVRVVATDSGRPVSPPGRVEVGLEGGPTAGATGALTFQEGAWVGTLEFPAPGPSRVLVRITAEDGRQASILLPVQVTRRP